MKNSKFISSESLKEYFIHLLSDQFEGSRFSIDLGFESSFKDRICTLRFNDEFHAEIRINLNIKKTVRDVGFSLTIQTLYYALFIAEYVGMIERAVQGMPQTYFEGLMFLNAIEVYSRKKTVDVISPIAYWSKKTGRTLHIQPIEVGCAINALNRIISDTPEADEPERRAAKKYLSSLLQYAMLPEVSYNNSRMPQYAIIDLLKKLEEIVSSKPETLRKIPLLHTAPFDAIGRISICDLLTSFARSDNKFLTGIAIRMIGFFRLPYTPEMDNYTQHKLIEAMKQYIDDSVSLFYQVYSEEESSILKDNYLAVRISVKTFNDYLTSHGVILNTGNIHAIQ